jgi:hypothetical protein
MMPPFLLLQYQRVELFMEEVAALLVCGVFPLDEIPKPPKRAESTDELRELLCDPGREKPLTDLLVPPILGATPGCCCDQDTQQIVEVAQERRRLVFDGLWLKWIQFVHGTDAL